MLPRFKKFFALLTLALLSVIILNSVPPAQAATSIGEKIGGGIIEMGKSLGVQPEGGQPVVFSVALIKVVNIILGFTGILFFILLLYGGFLWMTAREEAEQVVKAKKIIRQVITGLIIILTARLLTEFLLTQLSAAGQITQ